MTTNGKTFSYDFEKERTETFKSLKNETNTFDLLLCCTQSPASNQAVQLQAHGLLLSASSMILRDLISNAVNVQTGTPIIILTGIYEQDLKYILKYIYEGEVYVPPECETSFLRAADSLGIKGIGPEKQEPEQKLGEQLQKYFCVFTDPNSGGELNINQANSATPRPKSESKVLKKPPKGIKKEAMSNVVSKIRKVVPKSNPKDLQTNNEDEQNLKLEKTDSGGGLCLVCATSFSIFGNCKAHYIKKHGEEVPGAGRYNCLICEFDTSINTNSRFNFQANFKEHLKSQHKVKGNLKRVAEEGDDSWLLKDDQGGGYCLKCNTYFTIFGNLKAHFNKKHANI